MFFPGEFAWQIWDTDIPFCAFTYFASRARWARFPKLLKTLVQSVTKMAKTNSHACGMGQNKQLLKRALWRQHCALIQSGISHSKILERTGTVLRRTNLVKENPRLK